LFANSTLLSETMSTGSQAASVATYDNGIVLTPEAVQDAR